MTSPEPGFVRPVHLRAGWLLVGASALTMAVTLASTASAAEGAAGSQRASAQEEVTVTARKKEERLLDVPVAAQVLSAGTINRYNTTDLIQLSTITTGVQIARTGGGTPGGCFLFTAPP